MCLQHWALFSCIQVGWHLCYMYFNHIGFGRGRCEVWLQAKLTRSFQALPGETLESTLSDLQQSHTADISLRHAASTTRHHAVQHGVLPHGARIVPVDPQREEGTVGGPSERGASFLAQGGRRGAGGHPAKGRRVERSADGRQGQWGASFREAGSMCRCILVTLQVCAKYALVATRTL